MNPGSDDPRVRKKELGFTVLEILDRFGNISGKQLYGYLEQEVTDLRPEEFANTLHRLERLELVEDIDAGYAFIYAVTNQGIVALESHRSNST
ncbi:hypothetical protein HTG_00125 [Natrinema mahii]|nr:hypothetical protein HTG_00125 [Natrinema mahii]